jgi:hypothetical protein
MALAWALAHVTVRKKEGIFILHHNRLLTFIKIIIIKNKIIVPRFCSGTNRNKRSILA